MIVELSPIADFILNIYFIKCKENTFSRRQTEGTYMGMSITETVYLSLYLSLVAKKNRNKEKKYKVEKKKSCICLMK